MKLSRAQIKNHEQANDLVHGSDKPLTIDERLFVLDNWFSGSNMAANGAFFTKTDMARQFAIFAAPAGNVVDLCAGIGSLAFACMYQDTTGFRYKGDIKRMVCAELNRDYIKVGRRVLPEAEWIECDIFNQDYLIALTAYGKFDSAISNPPFGNVPGGKWMKLANQPAHIKAIETILLVTHTGGMMILPREISDYDLKKKEHRTTKYGDAVKKAYPFVRLPPIAVDYDELDFDFTGIRVEFVDVSVDGSYDQMPRLVSQLELL